MALFHLFKKKAEKKAPTCCCGSAGKTEKSVCVCGCSKVESIKVLGAGCKSCHNQYEYVKEAVRNLGLSVEVAYITDMEKIMEFGVMSMPAIVVNEKVVSFGKVLKTPDVEKLLKG